jgi:FMN-dependent NADH-azoreductase
MKFMPTLLQINSSPLETSISRELTGEYVTAWKVAHHDGQVISRDLAVTIPQPVNAAWISANFTPAASRSEEQKQLLAFSDELIGELEAADEYVIGVAMHNFSIPSTLKLWIDQIARGGRTFSYSSAGPKGLLEGKKATVVVASGGVYEPGTPTGGFNFVEPYLRAVLGFLGVTDVTFVTASGAAKIMSGAVDRATFLQPALERIRAAAA